MSTIAYFRVPGGGGGVSATIISAGIRVAFGPTLACERLRVRSARENEARRGCRPRVRETNRPSTTTRPEEARARPSRPANQATAEMLPNARIRDPARSRHVLAAPRVVGREASVRQNRGGFVSEAQHPRQLHIYAAKIMVCELACRLENECQWEVKTKEGAHSLKPDASENRRRCRTP